MTDSPIIPPVDGPFSQRWPHPKEGPSVQYEFGRKGMGAPVTMLIGNEEGGPKTVFISWRDAQHLTIDDAINMVKNLQLAITTALLAEPVT